MEQIFEEAMRALFSAVEELGPTCPSFKTQPPTVGGRDTLQATCPAVPRYGYEDYIPDGTIMLTIGTGSLLDAQLAALFQQIIASFTFST